MADRWQRLWILMVLLVPAGLVLWLIPSSAVWLINAIIARHPMDQPIPLLWQKLDPVLGSALIFLMPCAVLAMLSPYMIRLSTQSLAQVGRSSGFIIAASTVGSIAGVFVAGFVLIDQMKVSHIFRLMGVLTVLLGLLCAGLDPWLKPAGSWTGKEPTR
jgi:MFS family permease